MSSANPASRLGDNGVKLPPNVRVDDPIDAVFAVRSKDSNRPRIANSIMSRCGSVYNENKKKWSFISCRT